MGSPLYIQARRLTCGPGLSCIGRAFYFFPAMPYTRRACCIYAKHVIYRPILLYIGRACFYFLRCHIHTEHAAYRPDMLYTGRACYMQAVILWISRPNMIFIGMIFIGIRSRVWLAPAPHCSSKHINILVTVKRLAQITKHLGFPSRTVPSKSEPIL